MRDSSRLSMKPEMLGQHEGARGPALNSPFPFPFPFQMVMIIFLVTPPHRTLGEMLATSNAQGRNRVQYQDADARCKCTPSSCIIRITAIDKLLWDGQQLNISSVHCDRAQHSTKTKD